MWDASRHTAMLRSILSAARIPGGALAIVAADETIVSAGCGFRDADARLPMTADTLYPIASTVKAMNATVLAMLVEEGKLHWDRPVQSYLPGFRLHDHPISHVVTERDLVTMRTGLPGHDFVWLENPTTRARLVEDIAHLPLSRGLRECFQYSDLSVTIASHVAEIITGTSWESLVQERIFAPLGMSATVVPLPLAGNITRFYHENRRRELLITPAFQTELIAPAGGAATRQASHASRAPQSRHCDGCGSDGAVSGRGLRNGLVCGYLSRARPGFAHWVAS